MAELLSLLVVLACPVMMILMMRGHHGGHHGGAQDDPLRARIAELEHEVALLRATETETEHRDHRAVVQ